MTDVFPRRNLPPRAEQWGRSVEGEIVSQEKALTQQIQGEGNWDRAAAGRLSVLSRNVAEIGNRASDSVRMASFSVTGSAEAEPFPRQNRTVNFSGVPGDRTARVVLTGTAVESVATQARLYVYLLFNGEIVGSSMVQPSAPASTPSEWQNNGPIFVLGTVRTTSNVISSFQVRIVRSADAFSPGTSTITFTDPIITLTYSGEAQ